MKQMGPNSLVLMRPAQYSGATGELEFAGRKFAEQMFREIANACPDEMMRLYHSGHPDAIAMCEAAKNEVIHKRFALSDYGRMFTPENPRRGLLWVKLPAVVVAPKEPLEALLECYGINPSLLIGSFYHVAVEDCLALRVIDYRHV